MQNLYELGMDFLNKAFDDSFSNIEFFFLAYAAALAVFWLRKKQNLKSFFVYPAVFAFFTVFNPYLMIPIADKICPNGGNRPQPSVCVSLRLPFSAKASGSIWFPLKTDIKLKTKQ